MDARPGYQRRALGRPSPRSSGSGARCGRLVAEWCGPRADRTHRERDGHRSRRSGVHGAAATRLIATLHGDDGMKIGFIGLGRMGAAMAANLVRAGHDVTVFNRSPGKAAALIGLGARETTHLADACAGRAVLSMLANDEAASDITLGEDG